MLRYSRLIPDKKERQAHLNIFIDDFKDSIQAHLDLPLSDKLRGVLCFCLCCVQARGRISRNATITRQRSASTAYRENIKVAVRALLLIHWSDRFRRRGYQADISLSQLFRPKPVL